MSLKKEPLVEEKKTSSSSSNSAFKHALAGSSASAIGTICLHPLDNIKVRLQGEFVF